MVSLPIPMCVYFADGYCAKGDYCEFSHVSKSEDVALCKFFMSGSCRFGKSCAFRHGFLQKIEVTAEPPKFTARVETITAKPKTVQETPDEPNTFQDPWGFDDSSGDQDAYFYGAPGTFRTREELNGESIKPTMKRYADVVGRSSKLNETDDVKMDSIFRSKQKPICQFHLIGTCKFGRLCKFSHESLPRRAHDDEAVSENTPETTEQRVSSTECGICIGVPTQFGLLNNCNCVFCLACIREWRREGLTVALSGDKVRLCPLCRVDSHFVTPSPRFLEGEEKEAFLNTYKVLLAQKPCKFYQDDGECPFSTSCFYAHISRDGVTEAEEAAKWGSKVGPRVILNSRGEATSVRSTLSDIVTASLRL